MNRNKNLIIEETRKKNLRRKQTWKMWSVYEKIIVKWITILRKKTKKKEQGRCKRNIMDIKTMEKKKERIQKRQNRKKKKKFWTLRWSTELKIVEKEDW